MTERQSYHNKATSEDCDFWRRELAELKGNLRLIEERLSQFVMSTDLSNLQLVKRKRELETQIADLEERLATQCDEGRMTVKANMERAPQQAPLAELRKILGDRFDVGELRDLCFDLGVSYDDLPGRVKADKVRELLRYLERRDRIPELVRVGKQLRPDTSWEDAAGIFVPSPTRPVTLPQINTSPQIQLAEWEKTILQHVHQGCAQVIVESEFGGGYSGTRVLLTLPLTAGGARKAHKVSKLGLALELGREWNTYKQFVADFLPFCAAQVREYNVQGDQAGLNYVFVGGGALGRALDLETYYRQRPVEQVVKTLGGLLDRELGQRWYSQATPLNCLFTAEYGRHLVEHLRLRMRPASSDALMPENRSWDTVTGYRRIDVNDIPHQYETIRPGTLLEIEGMVVAKIKHGLVKLQDPGGQGIIVRVALDPASNAASGLEVGSIVSARGEVIYNRRDRMAQIVRDAFPDLSSEVESEFIGLPSNEGTYPNPLRVYLDVLSRTMEGRRSYVHGDLHLRNVLVDETGKGWLIDFARVEQRHNLFDFIKLETYVRLMVLATVNPSLLLDDYVRFEQSLADDTLGKGEAGQLCPANRDLEFAHQVIRAIRGIARKYMGPTPDFRGEYFPALFLYCLAMTKYHQENNPQPTRLTFATACVLGRYVLGQDDGPHSSLQSIKGDGGPPAAQPPLGSGNRWAVLVGVNEYEDEDEVNYRRLHVCVKDVQAI